MQPPNLACVAGLQGLYEADLRDLAAAVLWLGCAGKLTEQVPHLIVGEVFRHLQQGIPELRRISLLEASPHARPVRYCIYEAVQVLEHNRLVLRRYDGAEHVREEITLTRRGRAAILSGDIRAYVTA
jgi:hypothetical protein